MGHTEKKTGMKATEEEIIEAMENMSVADRIKIVKYARFRVVVLTKYAKGRTHEDLIQEAVARILAQDRIWYREKADFLRFVLWVIKSISNHWTQEKDSDVESISWEASKSLIESNVFETAAVPQTTDQLSRIIHSETMESFYKKIEGDDEATLVFDELKNGNKGPDIQESLGLNAKEYDTIRKRLFRKLRK